MKNKSILTTRHPSFDQGHRITDVSLEWDNDVFHLEKEIQKAKPLPITNRRMGIIATTNLANGLSGTVMSLTDQHALEHPNLNSHNFLSPQNTIDYEEPNRPAGIILNEDHLTHHLHPNFLSRNDSNLNLNLLSYTCNSKMKTPRTSCSARNSNVSQESMQFTKNLTNMLLEDLKVKRNSGTLNSQLPSRSASRNSNYQPKVKNSDFLVPRRNKTWHGKNFKNKQ